jgi:hypothetical protein
MTRRHATTRRHDVHAVRTNRNTLRRPVTMHKLDVTTPGSARDVRKDECRVGEGDDKANVADRRLDERACIRLLYRGATPAQAVDDVAAGAMPFRIDFITRKNDRHSIRRMTQCPDTRLSLSRSEWRTYARRRYRSRFLWRTCAAGARVEVLDTDRR